MVYILFKFDAGVQTQHSPSMASVRASSAAARTAPSSSSSSPHDADAEPIDEHVQDEIIRGFERDAAAARQWARWLALALCAAITALALVCIYCGLDARTELEFHTLLRAGLGTEGLLALQLSSLASCLIIGQYVSNWSLFARLSKSIHA
jgi:hypothetical protein